MNKTPLTEEFFDNHPEFERDEKTEKWYREIDPGYSYFVSKDGRLAVNNVTNLSPAAWNIHVDNDCFESIASFDVETLEDANTVLAIYRLKI